MPDDQKPLKDYPFQPGVQPAEPIAYSTAKRIDDVDPTTPHGYALSDDPVTRARTLTGRTAITGALVMLAAALGQEIKELMTFGQMATPGFLGSTLMHIGAVGAAYLAGQAFPTQERLLPPSARK